MKIVGLPSFYNSPKISGIVLIFLLFVILNTLSFNGIARDDDSDKGLNDIFQDFDDDQGDGDRNVNRQDKEWLDLRLLEQIADKKDIRRCKHHISDHNRFFRCLKKVPLSVEEIKQLEFGSHLASDGSNIVVHPDDANAAVFKATGKKHEKVIVLVRENRVVLLQQGKNGNSQGKKEKVLAKKFKPGGSLNRLGVGTLNQRGELKNIRFGATAVISKDADQGVYVGTATIRIEYE